MLFVICCNSHRRVTKHRYTVARWLASSLTIWSVLTSESHYAVMLASQSVSQTVIDKDVKTQAGELIRFY